MDDANEAKPKQYEVHFIGGYVERIEAYSYNPNEEGQVYFLDRDGQWISDRRIYLHGVAMIKELTDVGAGAHI